LQIVGKLPARIAVHADSDTTGTGARAAVAPMRGQTTSNP
jgi:hypothetical protein